MKGRNGMHFSRSFLFPLMLVVFCAGFACAEDLAPNVRYTDEYTISGEHSFLEAASPLNPDGTANVVIEVPAGTAAKWEVRKPEGDMRWDFKDGKPRKVAYLGYPGNYGMLPRTLLPKDKGGDGDPLDVIVLGEALPRGSVARVKIIGVLKLQDGGEQDDKIIGVLENSALATVATPQEMDQKFPGVLDILKIWFENYKGPNIMSSHGYSGSAEAFQIIRKAEEAFETEPY